MPGSAVPHSLPGVIIFSALLLSTSTMAQETPAPAPAPPASTGPPAGNPGRPGGIPGNTGNPGQTQPGRPFPGQQDRQQQTFPEMQRTFFFSGKVLMDDGTPPPESVVIERVCNGTPKPEAYTDSKGRFHFQLGQNNNILADASTSSSDGLFGGVGQQQQGIGGGGFGGGRQISERDLMGCELRASLAGFRSDVVTLAGRRALDNPDVGTIVLRRMAKVDGFTFSATSAFAPKDARKAFEKGQQLSKKKKLDEAEKELQKAVTGYPKYAAAWYELGVVYHQQSKAEEARKAYEESVKADEKFITPYAQLARITAGQQKWEESASFSGRVIRLNPFFSPEVYFLNAVANLNLNKLKEAEESTRESMKLDPGHKNPRAFALLGIILAQKQDYNGAADNLKAYLKVAPTASDADRVRQQLSEIEKQITAGGTPARGGQTP